MSDHRGTREQPPDPPTHLGTEHGYLLLAAIAAATAGLLGTVDLGTDEDFALAVYILTATAFLVGGCGWLTRSEGARRRRDTTELLAELTSRPRAQARTCSVPRRPVGGLYTAGQGDTVGIAKPPIDADTVATVQRINLRLMRGSDS